MKQLAALSILVMYASGCSTQLHEPSIDYSIDSRKDPWRIHCETARSHEDTPGTVAGADHKRWIFARDDGDGEPLILEGELVDGFLDVTGARNVDGFLVPVSRAYFRELCLATIAALEDDQELLLGQVTAARSGENIDIPIFYPESEGEKHAIKRMVVFGDSLTDTGRLKSRLRVFPTSPYWIGRFSNGPVWPEYLALATEVAMQNHAYGGASVGTLYDLPGLNVIQTIKGGGQFFVSGSIGLQVSDYLERSLNGGVVTQSDSTAFLIWAGANDYISKEPLTGVITSFLDTPEGEAGYRGVVDTTITGIADAVRTLHAAGAQTFVLFNLPDLGRTPIVLQNTSYREELAEENDTARRMELARRLSELTNYHNDQLAIAADRLQLELDGATILLIDSYRHFNNLQDGTLAGSGLPHDYGFDQSAFEEVLRWQNREVRLQRNCYSGPYMGFYDSDDICPNPEQSIFWDVVHPSTMTHCWQALAVDKAMVDAGLLQPPSTESYLQWCKTVVSEAAENADGWSLTTPQR